MNHKQGQLFPTHEIEIFQALGELNYYSKNHPYLIVENIPSNGWVLDVNPVEGYERTVEYNSNGDICEVQRTVLQHSGIDVAYRRDMIARPTPKIIERIQGFGLYLGKLALEEKVEQNNPNVLFITEDNSDILNGSTTIIPLESISRIYRYPTALATLLVADSNGRLDVYKSVIQSSVSDDVLEITIDYTDIEKIVERTPIEMIYDKSD